MAGRKKDPIATEETRQKILETSFALFSHKSIDSVSVGEVAKACGMSEMTVYRYFSSKPDLVVAVSTWIWTRFLERKQENRPRPGFQNKTAAQEFDYYLDSFLELYRNQRDLLRFNQFFNVYICAEHIGSETLSPYRDMINGLKKRFHIIYEKAALDHTVRTDVPEHEVFRATLHLMLAAVTRYAVGLVYSDESEEETMNELLMLKKALLREYTTGLKAEL